MKFLFLAAILFLAIGYFCSYLLSRNDKRRFLSAGARQSVRRFCITCFFLGTTLFVMMLYVRIRY